jgi:glutamate dehydrogenase/leucine dehydrogenase
MSFLVVGYGNVGKATILVLRVLGHKVWVHDVNQSALKNSPVEVKVTDKDMSTTFVCARSAHRRISSTVRCPCFELKRGVN